MSYHDHSFLPPEEEELTHEERYARRVLNEVHRIDAAQIDEERRREERLEDDFSFTTDPHRSKLVGNKEGGQDEGEDFTRSGQNGFSQSDQDFGQGNPTTENDPTTKDDPTSKNDAQFASSDKPKKNRGTAFWQLISGTILLHEGLSQYYRYMLWIAVLFFASIAVMFMTLHLDRRYAELETQVRVLRAKATLLEEERCRKTTYTSIFNELKKRNIDLLPREKPWQELTE